MGLTLKPMCNDGLEIFPIPVFPQHSLISTLPLGSGLAAALGNARACLMQGHGVGTVAPTPEEAVLTMILVEEQAKMNVLARQSLGPNYSGIPQDQVEAYTRRSRTANPTFPTYTSVGNRGAYDYLVEKLPPL
jgi:ribulose-5-phosphate 4-epimerase/fuculose-1-phosphate aldolase